MPAPQKNLMTQMAKTFFAMNMIQLPMIWKDMGNQYPDAFELNELVTPPNLPPPVCLFREATLNKYHTDTAKTISDGFAKYIEDIWLSLTSKMS